MKDDVANLVRAERERPEPPDVAKEAARARLASLLGASAGLDGPPDVGDSGGIPEPRTSSLPANLLRTLARSTRTKIAAGFIAGGVLGFAARGRMGSAESTPPMVPFTAPSPSVIVPAPPEASSAPTGDGSSATSAGETRPLRPLAPSRGSAESGGRDTGLAAERSLVDRGRAALARGDGKAALDAMALHHTRFPNGQLDEECDVIAIQALVMVGRRDEAATRAGRFRRKHPGSILMPTVDEALR